MPRLEEAEFLARLTELYEKNRENGTVFLWMKRFAGEEAAKLKKKPSQQAEAADKEEKRCLVKAGSLVEKKYKLSTLVSAKDMTRFQTAIGNILRSSMDSLKRSKGKPVKRKTKKAKGTPKAKDPPAKKVAEK
mmetsp:Transcript_49526/g.115869  ORF Transcript_49526/g.115869 Transcript_49526/m.115869 type:complete len:133 (+) Transcript_49526:104-502(+)